MSKNFDQLPAASALTGAETTPVNQGGGTKYATISMIKTFIGTAFEAAGAIAAAFTAHLAAYTHSDIYHANRTQLNQVAGTNTGDQDLSGLAQLSNPHFQIGIRLPNSDNLDPNTLDWYQKNTWNPTDNSGANLTFSIQVARITRMGNIVFVFAIFSYPINSSTLIASIGGLPWSTSVSGQTIKVSTFGTDTQINGNVIGPAGNMPNSAVSGATVKVVGWYMV